jgi:hypothetical protein
LTGAIVSDQPDPISADEVQRRLRRAAEIASSLGFIGQVEYRHVYSQSGGAQYGIGPSADDDLLVVYSQAFDRDANTEDFDLDAMIAHEVGHQRLLRNAKLRILLEKFPGETFEEALASLVGSVLLPETKSAEMLVWKAAAELTNLRLSGEAIVDFVERMRSLLRKLL